MDVTDVKIGDSVFSDLNSEKMCITYVHNSGQYPCLCECGWFSLEDGAWRYKSGYFDSSNLIK